MTASHTDEPAVESRDEPNDESRDDTAVRADGGTVGKTGQRHGEIDYLDREVNLLRPSTPFMRDHLKVIWTGFAVWALIVFGPVTLTAVAPGIMTRTRVLGFPLHYFTVSLVAPLGALVLSAIYAYTRDRLDEKYGIDHSEPAQTGETTGDETAMADGGTAE